MKKKQLIGIVSIVILAFALGTLIIPRTVIVEIPKTETVVVHETDTVFINQTEYVYIPQVETVYINRTETIYALQVETIYVNRTDTVALEYAQSIIIAQAQNLTLNGVRIADLETQITILNNKITELLVLLEQKNVEITYNFAYTYFWRDVPDNETTVIINGREYLMKDERNKEAVLRITYLGSVPATNVICVVRALWSDEGQKKMAVYTYDLGDMQPNISKEIITGYYAWRYNGHTEGAYNRGYSIHGSWIAPEYEYYRGRFVADFTIDVYGFTTSQ